MCYELLIVMLFQSNETFIHLLNTTEEIFDEIQELYTAIVKFDYCLLTLLFCLCCSTGAT